jgi:dihydropteroate synthase
MRAIFDWNIGSRVLNLGKRTLVMGVVNVTPDSFSDGGLYFDPTVAITHALKLLDDGADIVDIGGESTRPGAKTQALDASPQSVSAEEELARVLPVIKAVKNARPDCLISVDTYKAEVARAAVEAGANILNDVSGFTWDAAMLKTLAALSCGAVLMHTRGRPHEWHNQPAAPDIVTLVKRELRERADVALMAGVKRDRLVLDPGFGFGKSFEENYPLLKRFDELHSLRYPLLAGVSRKSFIGRALARGGKDAPVSDRLYGTVAAETVAVLKGAHLIRTHNVKAAVDAARIADLIA